MKAVGWRVTKALPVLGSHAWLVIRPDVDTVYVLASRPIVRKSLLTYRSAGRARGADLRAYPQVACTIFPAESMASVMRFSRKSCVTASPGAIRRINSAPVLCWI